jgi:hypothetical protein
MSLQALEHWINTTSLSLQIKNVSWVVPIVQCVHILAITVVISAILLVNLRFVGIFEYPEPVVAFSRRYLQRVWVSLVILAISGALLIIGEPERTLRNPIFYSKMTLLAAVIITTLLAQRQAIRAGPTRSSSSSAPMLKGLAWTSIMLWVAIIFCGRWIAYGLPE